MAKIRCIIEYGETETDEGYEVAATWATCSRCGHVTSSYGDSSASVRRCLVLMREECSCPGSNFFIADNGDDEGDECGALPDVFKKCELYCGEVKPIEKFTGYPEGHDHSWCDDCVERSYSK